MFYIYSNSDCHNCECDINNCIMTVFISPYFKNKGAGVHQATKMYHST